MHQETATVEYQSVINTFRLCYPRQDQREIGYGPLRLGVKTIGVKTGFYREVLENGCRVKVSAVDLFRYLWRTRNQITFDVFSQN
ncbi:MAG TPA: hypothetical protein VHP63_05315 [candidate division Zixibacteria bacterium]|nr:hypothetical protein [candidate division Zixibacteria bacterium]